MLSLLYFNNKVAVIGVAILCGCWSNDGKNTIYTAITWLVQTGRMAEDGAGCHLLIQPSLLYLFSKVAVIDVAIIWRCCYDDGRNKIYTLQSQGLFQQAGWQKMMPDASSWSSQHCFICLLMLLLLLLVQSFVAVAMMTEGTKSTHCNHEACSDRQDGRGWCRMPPVDPVRLNYPSW